MAVTCATRRTKLLQIQSLINSMLSLNEQANTTALTLTAAGSADVADTVNKLLVAGGAASYSADTDDTLTSEAVLLLKALDWTYSAT